MKFTFKNAINQGDVINYSDSFNEDIDKYSEWHHFNFSDDQNGLYGIFNLSISGDLKNPNRGRAAISLVAYEKEKAWRGTMDLQPVEKVNFKSGMVDLDIGKQFVRLRKNKYHVVGSLKDDSISLNAKWIPLTTGIRITNIGGIINTFIIPNLRVEGKIRIDQNEYVLKNATGYHDHNWGFWDWGKDIGWDWGYIIQPQESKQDFRKPVSIVFGQVTDATRKTAKSDLVMLVWIGRECRQVFLDEALHISMDGNLSGVEIRRLPGIMALLYPGQSQSIPRKIYINARDGDDYLKIEMSTENALQFLIPHPSNTGKSVITELVGNYRIQGMVDGQILDFSFFGFTEVTS